MECAVYFQKAIPVWQAEKSREMNQMLCFEAEIDAKEGTVLRIAGQSTYRVFVNGEFVHFGPARAGHGTYRMEEIPIRQSGACTVKVIVAGYYCASYYCLRVESFLCAELVCGNNVLAATGDCGWRAYTCPSHLQRVLRYSYQRTFCEVYDERLEQTRVAITPVCVESKRFIARGMSIPTFDYLTCERVIGTGAVTECTPKESINMRFLEPKNGVEAFPSDTLELNSLRMIERMTLTQTSDTPSTLPVTLQADAYFTAAMEGNRTGLIALEVEAHADADVYLTFDEVLTDGGINPFRVQCVNVVLYRLQKGGKYRLVTAEPYTFQYINVIARGGSVTVSALGVYRVGFDMRRIVKRTNDRADEEIVRIAHAAMETFSQNTFDLYMDCPSRERAGWLCDSFFTARVEYLLTGKSDVERAFLSNFAMVDHFERLPNGMLPRCYPADAFEGEGQEGHYIPNWAMWFALQLEEYYKRTSDRALIDAFRSKLYALLEFFRSYENADGLLEKLSGWIFVEWSRCNELVQDINYPTNMLYYRFKRVLASLYGDPMLDREAEKLRRTIRAQSLGELFFCDNAVYGEDGVARLSGELTETCQYYAFFMGVATPEEDPVLWQTMVTEFGPHRHADNHYPSVHFANAFIGNYLRLDLLANAGLLDRLEENIRGYFDGMARMTDTLWEHDSTFASCNHGFASHVLVWLDRLGYLTD